MVQEILQTVVGAVIAWMNRQSATVVVLLGILTSIIYIAAIYLPMAFSLYHEEMEIHRKWMADQIQILRDDLKSQKIDDREQRALDRKAFESTLDRFFNFADHRRGWLPQDAADDAKKG